METSQGKKQMQVDGLWISKEPVTFGQFEKFVHVTNYKTDGDWKRRRDFMRETYRLANIDNLPIRDISWHDANTYARWAGLQLPTEAEWLWASEHTEIIDIQQKEKEYSLIAEYCREQLARTDSSVRGSVPAPPSGSGPYTGFRVVYYKDQKSPSSDLLTEMLDEAERIALRDFFVPVEAIYNGERILTPKQRTPFGITYERRSELPPGLIDVVKAQEYTLTFQYREALTALDRATDAGASKELLHYMRGDIYYYLALLNILKRNRFQIDPEKSVVYLHPDTEIRPLLVQAQESYSKAKQHADQSVRIELTSEDLNVPQISKQHFDQINGIASRSKPETIEVKGVELAIIAQWILQLFDEDSIPSREIKETIKRQKEK
jgi:hypothetical protein